MTEQLKLAIVRICTTNKKFVGVGVLVSHKHILTCAHVAAVASGGSKRDQAQPTNPVHLDFPYTSPGEILSAQVVFWRPAQLDWSVMPEMGADIAVLELDESLPLKTKPIQLQLVSARELVGHPFEVFGVPAGHPQGVFADGILRHELGNRWIQIQTKDGFQIEPGFSGSPIWDKQLNAVVGITVATDPNRPEVKVGFIIPTQVLFKAWSENEIIYQRIARYSAPYLDYTKLADLLKEGKWKEADRETITIMLNVVGRKDYLDGKSIENFPCIDLLTIDQLWMKYSKGRFGFSVQKRIWESFKHPKLKDQRRQFGDQVGWRKDEEWLMKRDTLTFNPSDPEGHLPWIIDALMDINDKLRKNTELKFLRGERIGKELRDFFSRLDTCSL